MPTALMLYMNQSRMVALEGTVLGGVLTEHGWTLLTAVSLMLFSLLHNPCGTTIWTIWRETKSLRWTVRPILRVNGKRRAGEWMWRASAAERAFGYGGATFGDGTREYLEGLAELKTGCAR